MLQKIHDSVGKWVAGIILGLLAIAFVFWGVDSPLTGATYAAKVNGEEISLLEFERELQNEQNSFAELYRTELSDDMRRILRRNVIERMVASEALEQRVREAGYRVSDERVIEAIRAMPQFQIDGQFSLQLARSRLASAGLTEAAFTELQRQQMALLDLQRGVAVSTFLTPAEFRRYIELYNQQREIAYALFDVETFLDDVEITDEAVAAYYDANRDRYMTQETVDIEYIELKQADFAAEVEVTDADVRAYYEQQRDRFAIEEERHARHILLTGDTEQARAAAAGIVERLEAGEDFAALAAELSQDAVTRTEGGDLGWITRGMLGGPFEEALFEMQVGEVRGPVETEFGVHVIKLEDIREGETRPFEEVADELREELQTLEAEQVFLDRANELADKAFDAVNVLDRVAEQMGLPLKRRDGLPRTGDPELFPNSAPVVQAAFDPDAIARGENSDLIELADDHALVLRVAAHHPSELEPLEAVRARVEEDLRRSMAEERARDAAQAFLAEAEGEAGPDATALPPDADGATGAVAEGSADAAPEGAEVAAEVEEGAEPADAGASLAALAERHNGTWRERGWIERATGEVPSEIVARVFSMRAPTADRPQIELLPLASGDYAVLFLYGVRPGEPESIPREQRDLRLRQLADQAAVAELNAYVGNVRRSASVRIPDEILEPQF